MTTHVPASQPDPSSFTDLVTGEAVRMEMLGTDSLGQPMQPALPAFGVVPGQSGAVTLGEQLDDWTFKIDAVLPGDQEIELGWVDSLKTTRLNRCFAACSTAR
jgi:hypothetical protein